MVSVIYICDRDYRKYPVEIIEKTDEETYFIEYVGRGGLRREYVPKCDLIFPKFSDLVV